MTPKVTSSRSNISGHARCVSSICWDRFVHRDGALIDQQSERGDLNDEGLPETGHRFLSAHHLSG